MQVFRLSILIVLLVFWNLNPVSAAFGDPEADNTSTTSTTSSTTPSSGSFSSINSDNDQDASRQTQATCGERCQDLRDANAFLDELESSEKPGTYTQILELIERVEKEAEFAQSQVRRYSKHGWGGLNRKRKRKKKAWQKIFQQLGQALIDLMNQAEALASATGVGQGPDFEAQITELETQVTEAAVSIKALDDAGVIDVELSAEDLAGLVAAGSAASGSSGSGNNLFGQDASGAGFQDLKGLGEESGGEANEASASRVGKASSGGFSSGSGGSSDTSRGVASSGADGKASGLRSNKLTTTEANTYKTHFNGDAIGISAASIFGIVNQKYKKSDKSRKFFTREF